MSEQQTADDGARVDRRIVSQRLRGAAIWGHSDHATKDWQRMFWSSHYTCSAAVKRRHEAGCLFTVQVGSKTCGRDGFARTGL